MRLGEFHTIEVTFKGTLLLLLKRVQADLTLSPEVISYGCSPWVMHIRFFALCSEGQAAQPTAEEACIPQWTSSLSEQTSFEYIHYGRFW